MSKWTTLDKDNWEQFLVGNASVLIVGKSDCEACRRWSEELGAFAVGTDDWDDVKFGKIMLDTPGLVGFKRASPWIAELDSLPYTAIYIGGEKKTGFMGGGVERLLTRLNRLLREAD